MSECQVLSQPVVTATVDSEFRLFVMDHAGDFLAEIMASPQADAPRLIYADYLEENGDPERAELIRVQCELARIPRWERRAKELRYRQWYLLSHHARRWHEEMPKLPALKWGRFERGFVSEVIVPSLELALQEVGRLRSIVPVNAISTQRFFDLTAGATSEVVRVQLTQAQGDFGRHVSFLISPVSDLLRDEIPRFSSSNWTSHFASCPSGKLKTVGSIPLSSHSSPIFNAAGEPRLLTESKIQTLRIHGSTASAQLPLVELLGQSLNHFLASEESSELRTLSLCGMADEESPVPSLESLSGLKHLKSIELERCTLDLNLINPWPDSGARWEELHLKDCPLSTVFLQHLLNQPQLSELKSLTLRGCRVSKQVVQTISRSQLSQSLRELNLSNNELAEGVGNSFEATEWKHLHTLNLRHTRIGRDDVVQLSENDRLQELIDLDLSLNPIGTQAVIALSKASWLPRLRRLSLQGTRSSAAAIIGDSPGFQGLSAIDLRDNPIYDQSISAFVEGDWPNLTELHLGRTGLTDVGILELARSRFLPRLTVLDLSSCDCSDVGLNALADLPMANLADLQLQGTKIRDEGLKSLCSAIWPNIRWINIDDCGVGPDGIRAFVRSPLYAQLQRFNTWGNQIPPDLGPALGKLQTGALFPGIDPDNHCSNSVW